MWSYWRSRPVTHGSAYNYHDFPERYRELETGRLYKSERRLGKASKRQVRSELPFLQVGEPRMVRHAVEAENYYWEEAHLKFSHREMCDPEFPYTVNHSGGFYYNFDEENGMQFIPPSNNESLERPCLTCGRELAYWNEGEEKSTSQHVLWVPYPPEDEGFASPIFCLDKNTIQEHEFRDFRRYWPRKQLGFCLSGDQLLNHFGFRDEDIDWDRWSPELLDYLWSLEPGPYEVCEGCVGAMTVLMKLTVPLRGQTIVSCALCPRTMMESWAEYPTSQSVTLYREVETTQHQLYFQPHKYPWRADWLPGYQFFFPSPTLTPSPEDNYLVPFRRWDPVPLIYQKLKELNVFILPFGILEEISSYLELADFDPLLSEKMNPSQNPRLCLECWDHQLEEEEPQLMKGHCPYNRHSQHPHRVTLRPNENHYDVSQLRGWDRWALARSRRHRRRRR